MLRNRFNEAMKDAMRAKEQGTLSTVRMILAKLKDKDIEARGKGVTTGLEDSEILGMLQGMIKQRQESVALYEQGGRQELADKERAEIQVIESFLPKQMSESEAVEAIKAIIAETGAASVKDMGKVMAELRARYAGQMDFGKASGLIKQQLSGG
ncbi:GatB/YqeY domain-containing protein [Azospirillum sp. sgz301742]